MQTALRRGERDARKAYVRHQGSHRRPEWARLRRQRLIELQWNSLWMARREQDRWHDNEQRDMHVADAMKLRRMRHNENPAPKSPNME